MSFKLENFVAAPSMELLNLAKKTNLLNIADHYALTSVKPSMLKHDIKNILIKFLVDKEILDPSALSFVLITDLQLRELEIQRQIQLEKLKLEQEERISVEQLVREERIRVVQLEREERMQKEKLEMEERQKKKERQIQRERLEME